MTILLTALLLLPTPNLAPPPRPLAIGDTVLVTRTEHDGEARYVHEGHGRIVRIEGEHWQVEGWGWRNRECSWWIWDRANLVRMEP